MSLRVAELFAQCRGSIPAARAALAMVCGLAGCAAPTLQSRDYAWEDSTLNLMREPGDPSVAGGFTGQARDDEDQEAPMAKSRPSYRMVPERAAKGPSDPGGPHAPPRSRLPASQPPQPADSPPAVGAPAFRAPAQSVTDTPAQLPAAPAATPPPQGDDRLRAVQRVEAAQTLLGTPGLQERAFVAHVLRAAGQDIAVDAKQPYAASLWHKLEAAGGKVAQAEARPGDLVFFRDTADLNGNGKPDDGVTLVGVVERVRGSHAVFIAQRAGKVRRMAVDATRPLVIRDAGSEVVNTRLVRWPGSDTPWTTGQCFFGLARP